MADTRIHPALTVNNIKNSIPITLEMEKGLYNSWAELFRIHCTVYQVMDHIRYDEPPPPPSASDKDKDKGAASTPPDMALWIRLDAVVLQWIYGTISSDLLNTIITTDSTAHQAWVRLQNIFQDNKHSQAVYLENQFSNLRLDNFSTVSAYCQELKVIADQLANVGSVVSNQRMVLQLIAGLNMNYDGVATWLQQTDPLPDFYTARSRLIMEETRKNQQASSAAAAAATALTATSTASPPVANSPASNRNNNNSYSSNRGRGSGSSRGNSRGNNRGCGLGRNNHFGNSQQQYGGHSSSQYGGRGSGNSQSWNVFQPWGWPQPSWSIPPCPYPTNAWVPPPSSNQSAGVLGPRPQQHYAASTTPTDIEQAMHTMNLNIPDSNWYMDTGASSHMAANQGFSDGETTREN